MESFWTGFGLVVKSVCTCFEVILGSFGTWNHFAFALDLFWTCFEVMLDFFGVIFYMPQGGVWPYVDFRIGVG